MQAAHESNPRHLRVRIESPDSESFLAAEMIRNHYAGARAAVFLDKDNTVIEPATGQPSAHGFETVVAEAQKRGIFVSWDSDSSLHDLHVAGNQFGMQGLHIAELGGIVGFPDGKEIHLVESSEWFNALLHQVIGRIHKEDGLRHTTAIYDGDPWDLIYHDIHLPGSQKQLVMVNRGRRVSASILTALLDQSQGGKIKRGTPESLDFYKQMTTLMDGERNVFNHEYPFPDAGGIRDDFNTGLEVAVMTSHLATKRRSMQYIAEVLGIPIFHIGDNHTDDTTGTKGVQTLAVGNGTCRDKPDVIYTEKIMTEGVMALFKEYILPQFS